MHISSIEPDKLRTRRLDADFYHPEHIAIEDRLLSLDHIEFGSCGRFFVGPFGSKLPSNLYLDKGVPLFRVANVGDFDVNTENLAHLDEAVHAELSASEVKPGDLLIVKASVGEKICKVPDWMPRANITQHIIAVRPNGSADVDFLAAFLFSHHGRKQLERYSLGSIIQYLGVIDARAVLIPRWAQHCQRYIGNKVRQAERLRALAKSMEYAFLADLTRAYPEAFANRKGSNKHTRIAANDIVYTLNPGAFEEERLRVQRYLTTHGGAHLKTIATVGGSTTNDYAPESAYIGLDVIASNSCELKVETISGAGTSGSSRLLPEGPIVSKLRPYLNKVSYVPGWLAGAVGSTELLCVQPKANLSGWYLYGVLKSEATLKQLRPLASGATHPRIDQADLLHLVVPMHPDHERLGALLDDAQTAYFNAGYLTTTAKLLVEALIEGQLTESDLIAAQQALEAGDDGPDRAILARLTADGLDGSGAPLFPDLDRLATLLARAASGAAGDAD
jgi:type I restriction enzyme, S subunit